MKEKLKHTAGSNVYDISSKHRSQEDSYFLIENVEIEEDERTLTYNFEFHFECKMYYNPQYRIASWRSVRKIISKGKITVDKDE